MDKFIEQHADRISGTLGCFDRMLFRGYLPIMSGAAMATFLKSRGVMRETLKTFLLEQAERLKRHAQDLCTQTGRPYEYLSHAARKEDLARKIAERDEITEGLVCVLSVVEPCRTFSLVWNGRSPYVQSARRKCLHFYYYFLDRDLGLIHVKLQSWFPFQIQIYVNGHEWLARQLDRHGIKYMKLDNAFVRLSDVERSKELADSFERVDWIHVLGRYALRVNPLLRQGEVLDPLQYYWVTAQSEYSTDILFRKRADLEELMPRLCQYSARYFSASDVMSFLGRKLTGHFQGEVVTDQREVELWGTRVPGRRVKHRMKFNWIKMYDKGTVLRVETVINNPEEFRVRRQVRRQGRDVMAWVPLRKSVTLLFRYREISAQSNVRYLDALSQVQDPTPAVRELDALTTDASTKDGRSVRAFNPLSRNERMLFEVLLAGEHALHGFTNRDVRKKLARTSFPLAPSEDRQPSQVTRLFRLFMRTDSSPKSRAPAAGGSPWSVAGPCPPRSSSGRSPTRHSSPLLPEVGVTSSRKTKNLRTQNLRSSVLLAAAVVQLRRERALERLRSEFQASASHELRTPLTQIRMFAETLRLGLGANDYVTKPFGLVELLARVEALRLLLRTRPGPVRRVETFGEVGERSRWTCRRARCARAAARWSSLPRSSICSWPCSRTASQVNGMHLVTSATDRHSALPGACSVSLESLCALV